jgi:hypothetical protein
VAAADIVVTESVEVVVLGGEVGGVGTLLIFLLKNFEVFESLSRESISIDLAVADSVRVEAF